MNHINNLISEPIKFVNPIDPFRDISIFDDKTIILPRLEEYELSNRFFLDDIRFSYYLDTILFNINSSSGDFKKVCHIIVSNIQEYFLQINLIDNTIKISSSLMLQIADCLNPHHLNYTKLIVIPIKLSFVNSKFVYDQNTENILNENDGNELNNLYSAHSNVIIIDNERLTIEFYEPHGISLQHPYGAFNNIPEIIQNYIHTTFNLYHYSFINAASICPMGAQELQSSVNRESGHCLAWSLYFIMLRILNVNYISSSYKTTLQVLHEYVTTHYTPVQLDIKIRQFMSFIDSLQLVHTKLLDNYVTDTVSNYISNTTQIENRLRELISIYFSNLFLYDKEFKHIFEEIISYRYLNNFTNIFITELSKIFYRLQNNK